MLARYFPRPIPQRFWCALSALVLTLIVPAWEAAAQSSGDWTAHTSMREITSIAVDEQVLWVGTTGGVFSYAPSTGEIRRYTIADGLHGIQVRSVAVDLQCEGDASCIWIGYQDGVLDRLDPHTGVVRSYRDIQRADRFSRREINRLVVHGDSLLVATSFGLVVFDLVRNEVRDSYTQFASLDGGTPVFDVLVSGGADASRIFAATELGVVHAPLDAPNLKDPAAWQVETVGLPSPDVRSLALFNDRLFVGTAGGTAVRAVDGTYSAHGITGGVVSGLVATPERLLGVDGSALLAIEQNGSGRRLPSAEFGQPGGVSVGPEGALWVGDRLEGLVQVEPVTASTQVPVVVHRFFPEGPYHNTFANLRIDRDGNLWAGGAVALQSGNGIYRRSPSGTWTDFIARYRPELAGRDSYSQIHVDPQGNLWAGSQGGSVAVITADDEIEVYDYRNSSIVGPASDSGYVLTGGIGSDPQGRVWITSRASSRPLNVYQPGSGWTNFSGVTCGSLSPASGTYDKIVVDAYGQLWIDVKNQVDLNQGVGLLVLNPMNTPTDPSDDVCRFFGGLGSAGSGMPGLEVRAMEEDLGGLMWIATDRGLAYFINNGLVAHDAAATPIWPQYEDRTQGVFLFQGLRINDVAVDPANQLWVATDAGAYLIRQVGSGFEEVLHWTSSNSPLLSDIVVAVTVDPSTGEVFFATDRGLVSYEGDAIAASSESRDLIVYPNPVRVGPDEEPAIFIEGLVEETEILILAPQGTVVSRFLARGGRARWDGRDQFGRLVPSGMYLVVAVGQNGEERAFGKVGIVR